MPKLQLPAYSNGMGSGKYDQSAYFNLVGVDIHSEIGVALTTSAIASGASTVVERSYVAIAPNGDRFYASEASGKIWKQANAGATTLVHTNTNGVHLGIRFYNGYLYYFTSTKLGRIATANASSEATWSTQNDSWATFTNGSTVKPSVICNLFLFIGDGKYLARVDSSGVFQANVLDIESSQSFTALENASGWIIAGLTTSEDIITSKVILWDTYSSSWTYEDELYESSINNFIKADNNIFINAGIKGNIYSWNGSQAVLFKTINSTTDDRLFGLSPIQPYASTVLNGRAYFALANRVYSLHRAAPNLPYAIVQELTDDSGQVKQIIQLQATTSDSCLVTGLTDDTGNVGIFFVNALNGNVGATIETGFIFGTFNEVKLPYETFQAASVYQVFLYTNCNESGWVAETGFQQDTTNMEFSLVGGPTYDGEIKFFRLRLVFGDGFSERVRFKPAVIYT